MKKGRSLRLQLIVQFGGACQRCGYKKCLRALHFHHHDSAQKKDWSGKRGGATNEEIVAHPERFLMLCANCHIEEHDAIDRTNRVYAVCMGCGNKFRTSRDRLAIGKGKYCRRSCQHDNRSRLAPGIESISQRFWKKVKKTDGCWEWLAYKNHGTDGMFLITDESGRHRPHTASRISYMLTYGDIPEGQEVIRTCDTPGCVRPDHHTLGTRADLLKLTALKRSIRDGKPISRYKLTENQVREIRKRHASGEIRHTTLSEEYGVTPMTISNIITRATWKNVD